MREADSQYSPFGLPLKIRILRVLCAIFGAILSGVLLFLSWTCGLVFFAGALSWIYQVPGYNSILHTLIIPYLGLYFVVFGLAFSLVSKRWGMAVALWAASLLFWQLRHSRVLSCMGWGVLEAKGNL